MKEDPWKKESRDKKEMKENEEEDRRLLRERRDISSQIHP